MPAKKLFFSVVAIIAVASAITAFKAPVIWSSKKNEIKQQTAFRDLNKNGKMDVYEDPSQPVEARINDLLKKMTIEEKAGMMFINGARINDDGSIGDKPGKGTF